jgi:hypothetical protein
MASPLDRVRRRIAFGLLLVPPLIVAAWFWWPDWPAGAPWASEEMKAAGRELFEHEWSPNDPLAHGDGLGPVSPATSREE